MIMGIPWTFPDILPAQAVLQKSVDDSEVLKDLSGVYRLECKMGKEVYHGTVSLGRVKQVEGAYLVVTTISNPNGVTLAYKGICFYDISQKLMVLNTTKYDDDGKQSAVQYMHVSEVGGVPHLKGRWLSISEPIPGEETWSFISPALWNGEDYE